MKPQAGYHQPIPRRIYWELTRACNLRCVHCRAIPAPFPSPDDLPTHVCLDIMDQIAEVNRPAVVLTGGEPLLREDLFELASYGKQLGFRMGLATNGTRVTADMAKKIKEAGFDRVGISLDGPDAETHDAFRQMPGAFERAMSGIKHLKRLGMYVQVNTSVTTHNAGKLSTILDLMLRLGVDAWHLFLLVPVGCGLQIAPQMQVEAEEYERILTWLYEISWTVTMDLRAVCAPHYFRIRMQRRMEAQGLSPEEVSRSLTVRRGCLAGSAMCFISYRGEVFPCGYLPVSAGDLKRQTFSEIWTDSPVLRSLRDPDLLKGKCGICEFRHLCLGCRARAYGMTGDYLAEEPFCLYTPSPAKPPEVGHG